LRIVETATKIIKEEIRSQVYELDTYSSSENFLCDLQNQIPEAFNLFLKTLIKEKMKKTKKNYIGNVPPRLIL